MKRKFPLFMYQLATACLMSCGILLFLDIEKQGSLFYPLALIPYSEILCVANLLLLRTEHSLSTVVIFEGSMTAVMTALIFFVGNLRGFLPILYALLFLLWLASVSFKNAREGLSVNTLMLNVELSMMMLIVFVAFCTARGMDYRLYLLPVAACTSSILGITVQRMDTELNLRAVCLLLAVFAIIFAMLWFMLTFIAAPAGGGIVAVWHLLLRMGKAFMDGVLWLITMLAKLFKPGDYDIPAPESAESLTLTGELGDVGGSDAILAVFCLLIIAALGYTILKLRKVRIRKVSLQMGASVVKSRPSLKNALRKAFGKLHAMILFECRLFQQRNTPTGLYIRLSRACRMSPLRKKAEETPSEFLTRLSLLSADNEKLKYFFICLTEAVNKAVFSDKREAVQLENAAYSLFNIRLLAFGSAVKAISPKKLNLRKVKKTQTAN